MRIHNGQYDKFNRPADDVEMFGAVACDGAKYCFYSEKAAIGWLAIRFELQQCAKNRFSRNSNSGE